MTHYAKRCQDDLNSDTPYIMMKNDHYIYFNASTITRLDSITRYNLVERKHIYDQCFGGQSVV